VQLGREERACAWWVRMHGKLVISCGNCVSHATSTYLREALLLWGWQQFKGSMFCQRRMIPLSSPSRIEDDTTLLFSSSLCMILYSSYCAIVGGLNFEIWSERQLKGWKVSFEGHLWPGPWNSCTSENNISSTENDFVGIWMIYCCSKYHVVSRRTEISVFSQNVGWGCLDFEQFSEKL